MRVLLLGGNRFLGRAIARDAIAAGHEVTCASRGLAGATPSGAEFVRVDRDSDEGLEPLSKRRFDAVIDVSRHPGQVRRAITALREQAAHWSFVSTVSVYADNGTPGQRADTAQLKAALGPEIEHATEATYGAAKVACEAEVGDDSFICRAGLIVGPEDTTGRFSYWPERLARGGEVLAPGSPNDAVQFIDVRDLARWIVHAAQIRLTGVFDAIGPSQEFGQMLAGCAAALSADCKFAWVDRSFLEREGVKPWAGPGSLPLWLPQPEYAGFATRDTTPAKAAGLVVRPLSETARDTLRWLRDEDGPVIGLTLEDERAILARWRERPLT